MGWNLPPGCTDKDVDDAAPQEPMSQCDCCGEWWREEDIEFSPCDQNNAGIDTFACPKCRRPPPDFPFSGSF